MQPSLSTQMIVSCRHRRGSPRSVPRPTGPATGMMMSAPWSSSCSVVCRPFVDVLEVTGEQAVLGRRVPADELDVLAGVLVVLGDAGGEAVHEDRHGREVEPP